NVGDATTPGTVTELSGVGDGTFRVPTNFDVGLTPSGLVEQFIPGEPTPVIVVSNELSPTGATAPIDLRINLRQLSARRSNGIAISGPDSGGNLINSNFIGIDINGNQSVNGSQARANAANGILIAFDDPAAAPGKRIGNQIGNTFAG